VITSQLLIYLIILFSTINTKHVGIDQFLIKEKLDDGTLELSHVNSSGQIAGCLTKGLGVKRVSNLV
jgi:hypothetical protein